MNLTHKDYFKIAFPFIISTVTQPLLGAVDTAVIGKLGIAELIGGVAIGTVIMNTLYWLFGFFRISTTGQSAIALGKNSHADLQPLGEKRQQAIIEAEAKILEQYAVIPLLHERVIQGESERVKNAQRDPRERRLIDQFTEVN
ncbi:hypothetical protein GNP89_03365 [Aliivibrio fischeri]|nr:hypothetical protein [Aliivibrio fischeri]